MRRFGVPIGMLLICVGLVLGTGVQAAPRASVAAAPTLSNFELVGQNPLFARGMNSAAAIYGNHLYVGNRTDGSDMCVPATGEPDSDVRGCPHTHPGVLTLDISNPASPQVVDEIGPPLEANVRETSRELRVWPQRKLLIVQNMRCSSFYHACPDPPPTPAPNFRFYDVSGDNAASPKLVSTYRPNIEKLNDPRPHEFFLWVDPKNPRHALMYWTTFSNDTGKHHGSGSHHRRRVDVRHKSPNLIVTDISRARKGVFKEVARINLVGRYSRSERKKTYVALHSLSVSPNGRRAYLAMWGGTYLALDTSDLAKGRAKPKVPVISPIKKRPYWDNPMGHSAVKVPGRPYVVMTDEIYGDYDDVNDAPLNESGCPWGWMHIIDIKHQRHPTLLSQFKTPENHRSFCASLSEADKNYTSYSTHNLTVLPHVVISAWHSDGLRAVDIADPANPAAAGTFIPQPLPSVATEDPALSRGTNGVVVWSYPIIKDGLIYVIDIRNGLYVLRYTGPHADEVASTGFLEGNSNVGDAVRLESRR
jgi:LVIVD repeat